MYETAVVIDIAGRPMYWHLPLGRTAVHLPDSRELWEVLWEARERVLGLAHSHPGCGRPAPSMEDVTTFSAVEAALGRRLVWWIATEDQWAAFQHGGLHAYDYARFPIEESAQPSWLAPLRELSYGPRAACASP